MRVASSGASRAASTAAAGTRQVVMMRHGQSEWNLSNRFTGWVDCALTPQGEAEARRAGALLRDGGFVFDAVHTSVLKRAIKTAWLALEELDALWLPQRADWRLNERHFGALSVRPPRCAHPPRARAPPPTSFRALSRCSHSPRRA